MEAMLEETEPSPDNATIRISCVGLPNLEYSVEVSKSLTVSQFKDVLSQQFPLKPKVNEQRLIAMGKQLDDKDCIRNILKESTSTTFHLILRNMPKPTPMSNSASTLNCIPVGGSSDTITIHFKCIVFQEDINETVRMSSTVKELKKLLSMKLPSKPSVEDMRLIYHARVLSDDNTLLDIFKIRPSETPTVNVIITAHGIRSPSFPTASTSSNPTPITSASSPNTGNAVLDQLRHRNIPYQIVSVNGVLCALHPKHPPAVVSTSGQPEAQPQNPAPAQAPAAPVIPDEFGEHRPGQMNTIWLVTKLVILAYLFSQNGGILRTVFVNVSAILIYLFSTGNMQWFQAWIRALNQPRANQAVNNNVNETDLPRDGDNQVEFAPRSYFEELKDILVSFFTSLIPETHEAVLN